MSFLNRSVPLKYAILGVVAVVVFATTLVHGLQSRSDSIAHYGTALPAKVVKADEPKTVGSILGFWGSTYTNTKVKVTPSSGKHWYYSDVPLGGSVDVGEELKVWFYDGNPNSARFPNWFSISSKKAYEDPWSSVEYQIIVAFLWMLLATVVTFVVLWILSRKKPRKRRRPASSRRKPKAA